MGIEASAAQGGVAGETVALGVAGHAALQVLSGGLAVTENEGSFSVVIPCVQGSSSRESGLDMAVGAELTGVVAIAAAGLPGIGRGRMAGEEASGMVARRRVRGSWTMTIETLGSNVTALARLRPGIGAGAVDLGKVWTM
jgi:hypothetical protein